VFVRGGEEMKPTKVLHRIHRAGQFWCGPAAPNERGTSKPEKVTCRACLARFDVAAEKRKTSLRLLTDVREKLVDVIRRKDGSVFTPPVVPRGSGADRPDRQVPMTDEPCPRCLPLAQEGKLRMEAVQRLPSRAWAPVARDRSGKCCRDCAAADVVMGNYGMTFEMARIAVANDRQEQYRLPGVPTGLVHVGIVRPSKQGDFDEQTAWLDKNGWFGQRSEVPE
jgi:hypothetical protein